MASQLQYCSKRRAMKLHNTVPDHCIFLIRIVVLSSLYRTGVCKRLPVEPLGYISIDCGGGGGYNDNLTGLAWVADEEYLESYDRLTSENLTFSSKVVLNKSSLNNPKQLETARIFSFDLFQTRYTKFCYTVDLSLSNNKSRSYLIRAMFPPRQSPWNTPLSDITGPQDYYLVIDTTILNVVLYDQEPVTIELLAMSLGDSMDICVAPSALDVMPAISSLEIRSIPEILYPVFDGKVDTSGRALSPELKYYLTVSRLNFGGNESSPAIRYPLDRHDRLWYAASRASDPLETAKGTPLVPTKTDLESEFTVISLNYSSTIPNGSIATESEADSFQVPLAVLTSAWKGQNLKSTISFTMDIGSSWSFVPSGSKSAFCLSTVLFDFDADADMNRSRSVDISNKDSGDGNETYASQWVLKDAEVPKNQSRIWSDRTFWFSSRYGSFEIAAAASSALPAMINALELYAVIENVPAKTSPGDVSFVRLLLDSVTFPGQMDSFGDPCLPWPWDWVRCVMDDPLVSIGEIYLSSQDLHGNLPEDFELPGELTILDLSNNSLSGTFPSGLGGYSDLSDNNFTGSIFEFSSYYLGFVNFSSNNLSGGLTRFTSNLKFLEILDLSHNSFTGPVPAFPTAGMSTVLTLEVVNLSSNHLTGGIFDLLHVFNETDVLGIQPLRALRLENNHFSGMIPDDIWSSESLLETVDLSNNSFTELNLTSWTQSLLALKNDSFNGRQQVNLLSNNIRRVHFGGDEAISGLESRNNEDMNRLLRRTQGYILLGVNNEWCNSSELSRAPVLKRYLCRDDESDDYYYWTLLPLLQRDASSKRTLIISLGVSGSVFLAIACILLVFLGRLWIRMKDLRQFQEELAKEDVKPPFYKYGELRVATKNFSKENELGKGGFGTVYKAELPDRSIVAVKLLDATEQNFADFLKETVLITGIKHRHLVQLKGYSIQDKKRMLVYEFAENGNLAQALWGNGGAVFLKWAQRLKICIGIAKGLSYLHEELQPSIIHRDIKPYNILLDKN
ncbi:hypothetical protein R1sor_027000 [Riccia sorocarpa]|uniref:non-specific serine/threonine protein kinase n=1 Tax=Riccia sorocarpa TaxID=122646 RepID=A0ABD3GEQ7_9MARC